MKIKVSPPTPPKPGWATTHHSGEDLRYIAQLEAEVERLRAAVRAAVSTLMESL